MGGKFLLKTILVFCASGLSLWGIPSGANDDDELLLRQLSSLQEVLETIIETTRTALGNIEETAKTKVQELHQVIHDEEKWGAYANKFARMKDACSGYEVKMVILNCLASAIKDAALHGIRPTTYLPGGNPPDSNTTDPIEYAWGALFFASQSHKLPERTEGSDS